MFALLSLFPAAAVEPVQVDAATLSMLPGEYDGKRVQTELSLAAPIPVKSARALGCAKSASGFLLGPKLELGKAPGMLLGTWVLCADTELTKVLAPMAMSTGLTLEADITVKGPKAAPKVLLTGVKILEAKPLQ